MAIDPRIALAGQPVDMVAALRGGLQTGEMMRQRGMRDALLQAQTQQQQQAAVANQGSYLNQLATGLQDMEMQDRAQVVAQNMPLLQQMGFRPEEIVTWNLTNEGLKQMQVATQPFMQAQQAQGEVSKVDPTKYTPESLQSFRQTGDYSKLVPLGTTDENVLKIQEESRGELRKGMGNVVEQANVLSTNYGKLENLVSEIEKTGNRSAVAQALVSLVKLGDPGSVVKEEELKQALGAQSPTAAIADLLRSKGTDDGVVNSVIQSLDPLNPDTVDVGQLMATGQAMMAPNIENILGNYGVLQQRGTELLSEQGYKSIFGTEYPVLNNLAELQASFANPTAPDPDPGTAQPAASGTFSTSTGIIYTVE